MSGTPVLVAIPDQELRRSVEFVLSADGYEPVVGSFPQTVHFALAIIDEAALEGRHALGCAMAARLIFLSSRHRPDDCPPSWLWLEKPHLGDALHRAIEQALWNRP